MQHVVVTFPRGGNSVRPAAAAEAMHSHIGAELEAQLVHLRPSGLAQILSTPGPELIVWDVGLGVAANAAAAIRCLRASPSPLRHLSLVSFENDLDGLRLALASEFPWIGDLRPAAECLIRDRQFASPGFTWELRAGDFLKARLEPAPNVIWYDFYSPQTSPALWTSAGFRRLHSACGPATRLHTYCASTAARSAMLLGGFFVGTGPSTDAKLETTVAAVRLQDLERPLPKSWLSKLERSSRPFPPDAEPGALARLAAHPQFL